MKPLVCALLVVGAAACVTAPPGFVDEQRASEAIERAAAGEMTPAEARQYMRQPDPQPFPWEELLILGGAALGLPSVGVGAARYVKHRKAAKAQETA